MTDTGGVIITVIAFLVISIIGWILTHFAAKKVAQDVLNTTLRKNNLVKAEAKGSNSQKVIAQDARVDNLPCQRDPDYEQKLGYNKRWQEEITRRLERIEQKINGKK